MEKIRYSDLIDYETGEVNFEKIQSTFEIKNLELPMEEKGFILLTLAKTLEEAWKRACTESSKLVKKYIDRLDDSLKSMENDEDVLNELKKASEEILYAVHLKALGE